MNILFLAIALIIILFLYRDNYEPSQQDIQGLTYVDRTQDIKDYPFPQISRNFKHLGSGVLPMPMNKDDSLPKERSDLTFTRTVQTPDTMGERQLYLPDYYRKDQLSPNPSGTEELRGFEMNKDKSDGAWSDKNVSEHPKFYNSVQKDEITNIGSFFDKNNQYNDKTSANTASLTADSCFTDKGGNHFCEDNTRLQLIPPALISDPQKCWALNAKGMYKDNDVNYNGEKVMNGGSFFATVGPSLESNEKWSAPIKTQVGSCNI
jgi:hypothetical protein